MTTNHIIDLITRATRLLQSGTADAISLVWATMTPQERLGFDLFLVRVGHPCMTEAGAPEWRFAKVVQRHAELAEDAGRQVRLTPGEILWETEARQWAQANAKDVNRG